MTMMKTPNHPLPSDPSEFFKPEDALEQWKETPEKKPGEPSEREQKSEEQPGFPPEVPRHPPHESPEWVQPTPQEVPQPGHRPMPDWSPSSGDIETPIVDEPQNPTEHTTPTNPS